MSEGMTMAAELVGRPALVVFRGGTTEQPLWVRSIDQGFVCLCRLDEEALPVAEIWHNLQTIDTIRENPHTEGPLAP